MARDPRAPDGPCASFSESTAHDECKHCGWTEEAHSAQPSAAREDTERERCARVEPVAWLVENDAGFHMVTDSLHEVGLYRRDPIYRVIPLYAAPVAGDEGASRKEAGALTIMADHEGQPS